MYLFIGILLAAGIFFYIVCFFRTRRIICKVCCMSICEINCALNRLTLPFGFYYLPSEDIMSAPLDAWQREFGYHALFDRTAPHFQIVVDCEPVYFDYGGRTWMIEFWKGQYGINLGGEIGIYYADRIVQPREYDRTLFHCVSNEDLMPMSMRLFYRKQELFHINQCHWWLTGFCMGYFGEPEELEMEASVTFPDEEMLHCFAEGMLRIGYTIEDLNVCGCTVSFRYQKPRSGQPRIAWYCSSAFSQWKNRLFCKIFNGMTRQFECTSEKLLFLYYLIPPAFRHMITFRKNRKQKKRGIRRRRR